MIQEDLTNPNNVEPLEIHTCDNFNDSLEKNLEKHPDLEQMVQDFLNEKAKNPLGQYGNKDTHMGDTGKWGLVPKIKHTALAHDMRLFYTLEGKGPRILRLYGVHSHDESGTGNPKNMNRQDKLAKKMSKQKFEKL
jgi:hypothetical protein